MNLLTVIPKTVWIIHHIFVMHNFRLSFLVAKEYGLFIIRAHVHLMSTLLS